MDAVEGLKRLDGSFASWLRISDPFTGAILAAFLFAVKRFSVLPAAQTQRSLQEAFGQWGRPGTVRVDNGIPWGKPGGLPSAVSLWLAGLGVRMWWNEAYRPQQNGVVENTQGVSPRWAAPPRCANLEELHKRVQREDQVRRNEYPAIQGQSRREAYPGLCHSGRAYVKGCEGWLWELDQALQLLGETTVRRKVSKRGQVSAYHRLIQGGAEYGGQVMRLRLDAASREWVIGGEKGNEIRRRPANELTSEAIQNLKVAPR